MTTTTTDMMKNLTSKAPTLLLLLLAVGVSYLVYHLWTERPWTRDGQVRADIVRIAPRVSGYVVEVAVHDNQFVREGEILFRIDPTPYQLAVDAAQVQLQEAREDVAALEASVRAAAAIVQQREAGVVAARARIRQQEAALANARSESQRATRLLGDKAGSVEDAEKRAATVLETEAAVESARAALNQASAELVSSIANLEEAKASLGEPGDENVRIRRAMVQLQKDLLNLSWTSISAPVDGFITNLDVNVGAYGIAGTPIAAFVDSESFRVDGYFQETKLRHIRPGDEAIVTLMSHKNIELDGTVESIGYAVDPPGVANTEGVANLVPQVEPTFDWIRLPQRVPVRIRLKEIPENVQLVAGMTASIAIRQSRDD